MWLMRKKAQTLMVYDGTWERSLERTSVVEEEAHSQRSIRSEGSLLFMTFSRMAAFASSSFGCGCAALGLRNAFQAKERRKILPVRGREMYITLRTDVCIHPKMTIKGRRKKRTK